MPRAEADALNMARLSTHVLDLARGTPAAGIIVDVHMVEGGERRQITRAVMLPWPKSSTAVARALNGEVIPAATNEYKKAIAARSVIMYRS